MSTRTEWLENELDVSEKIDTELKKYRKAIENISAEFANEGHFANSASFALNWLNHLFVGKLNEHFEQDDWNGKDSIIDWTKDVIDFMQHLESDDEEDNEISKRMYDHLVKMLETFENNLGNLDRQKLSDYMSKVFRYESLTPLTGEDDEWMEILEDTLQNKRNGEVFKNLKTGQAYFINGKVFREPSGACYTCEDSAIIVTFPYTPTTEYIDVEELNDEEEDG